MGSFLAGTALTVAPQLLDAVVTSRVAGATVSVRLSETEAYEGADDPGSHAFRGPTARNAVMFGPPGRLYVYRHLGLHHCVNVVCGPAGSAAAVLLRAGEVVEGHDVAWQRRTTGRGVCRRDRDLARGPARLAVVLGLTREHDGVDLLDPHGPVRLRPAPGGPAAGVRRGARVGVSGAGGEAGTYPWRFWLDEDPTVSAYRRA
ncbi:DNA-3-methyladenine glycosylase [Jannaschia sp. R86511]|uniref:DNA-3-methyladenine glycosylase n=1 Tax=Jannaschia sp. R86511 TaxID=3093853 RepID=UPI0036D3702B